MSATVKVLKILSSVDKPAFRSLTDAVVTVERHVDQIIRADQLPASLKESWMQAVGALKSAG